jgi:hypothetical protein
MITGIPQLRSLLSLTGLGPTGSDKAAGKPVGKAGARATAGGGPAAPRDTAAAAGRRTGGGGSARAGGLRDRVVRCDTVTVPLRHGLEAVDILRLRRACGSVVQGPDGAVAFLVPAGTAEGWELCGTRCIPGAEPLSATDPRWLVPPAGSGLTPGLTDPGLLHAALCEAERTLTAGGQGPV